MVGSNRFLVALALTALLAGCLDRGGSGRLGAPSPLGGFSDHEVFPGTYDTSGLYSRVLAAGTLDVLPDEIVTLASDLDGEPIQIGLLRPDVPDGTRVPVLIHASPYFPVLREGGLRQMPADVLSGFFLENFVPHGYAVAFVAVRGTSGSGGCWDWYGPSERADLAQVVDWLATQAWSNGNLAVLGGSFGANPAWEIAGLGHPAVKTIVPGRSEPDAYSWVVRNGTISVLAAPGESTAFWAMGTTGQYVLLTTDMGGADYVRTHERVVASACPEVANALSDSALLTASGARPTTGFFAERDLRAAVLQNYNGSVFLVHGLQDFFAPVHMLYPFANQLEAKNITVKHLLGQWTHQNPDDPAARTHRWDYAELVLRWLDHELKGNVSVELGPRVQVADSSGRWRSEDSWPPRDADWTVFHLGEGSLSREEAADGSVVVLPDAQRAVYDPMNLREHPPGDLVPAEAESAWQPCAVCATFATEPLEEELRFAGLPRVHLTATPLGPGGHVTAYLFVEDAAGNRERVGWGTIDLRFADGGEESSLVVPNLPLDVKMELEPLDAVAPVGSRLVLVLSQSGYGDTFFYYRSATPTYPVRVEVGGEASVLKLPVIARGDEAFFEPPG